MIKKFLGLLVLTLVINSCTGGCPDDCCLGEPCYDEKLPKQLQDAEGKSESADNYVIISNICGETSENTEYQNIPLTCDQLRELDYINNPPEACLEITLTGSDGISYTGLYQNITSDPECE